MQRNKAAALLALALAGALIASPVTAAKKTTKKTTKKPATTAAPTTAAPAATAAPKDTSPIKVMVIGTLQSPTLSFPEIQTMFDARVQGVNDAGGIGGRKISVIYCNDKQDANEAGNCARKAVSEKVVAVSGPFTLMGDSILSVLEPAGIAYVGSSVLAPKDSTSKVAFPFGGGVFLSGLAAGKVATDNGCLVGVAMSGNVGASVVYLDSTKKAFELSKGIMEDFTRIDTGNVPDFSPIVASILKNNPTCLFALNGPADNAKLLGAIAQSGKKVRIFTGASSLPQALVSALPASLTEGAMLVSQSASINDTLPEIADVVAEAKKYNVSDKDQAGSFGLTSYLSAKVLFNQMKLITGDITAASMLDQMGKMTDPGTTLLGGKFSTAKEAKLTGYNRVFNFNVFVYLVKNKQLVLQKTINVADLADKFA